MRPFSVAAAESGVICSTVSSLFSANATDSQLVGLALVMAALELAGCAAALAFFRLLALFEEAPPSYTPKPAEGAVWTAAGIAISATGERGKPSPPSPAVLFEEHVALP